MIIKKKQVNFKKIINIYNNNNNSNLTLKNKFKLYFLSIFMHKKLLYFRVFYKNNFYIYSAGHLLGKKIKKLKYFKKSLKNFSSIINILNKKLNKKLNSIFIFYCKNFNYKNYLLIKKFFYLIKPNFHYFITTDSWNYIKKKKKNIKRRVLRNLFKVNKFV